jgi:NHL repeat
VRFSRAALGVAVIMTLFAPAPAGAAVIKNSTVKEFATSYEKTLSAVLDDLLPRLGNLKTSQGNREKLIDFTLKTSGGTVKVEGLGLLLPKPRRYDLTLDFNKVKQPGRGKPLVLSGVLQFDFIEHGRGLADGLFRGVMKLGGTFRGSPEVYGEVINGNIVSLVAKSGSDKFRVGKRNPRTFLSYTETLAGNGTLGDSNGTGSAARFSSPQGIVVAEDGTVYVADSDNDAIRKITPQGKVTTLATGLDEPSDVGIDAKGDLIVSQLCTTQCNADTFPQKVPLSRMDPSTGELTPIMFNYNEFGDDMCGNLLGHCDGRSPIGTISWPSAVDVQGNVIYVAQSQYSASLRMVLPDGYATTLRYSGAGGRDGGDCGDAGILGGNSDVAKGLNGRFYYLIPGAGCYGVLELQPDGSVSTVAGKLDEPGIQDGTGEEARFGPYPTDLVFDGIKYLYVADSGNALIRRVDVTTGAVVRVAGCLSHVPGFDCTSQLGFRDGNGDRAMFHSPDGIALDQWGDLYLADRRNHSIRVIRIVTDPGREPTIDSFQPFGVEQGTSTTLEVRGRNLGLAESASLGEGVSVDLRNAGSRKLLLDIAVDPAAAPGPRTLRIQTPYGTVETPANLSLEVLAAGISGAMVTTVAGTGSWSPGFHDGPAEKTEIGFAAGMDAIDTDRLLFADTLEQRVRLLATKDGAIAEVIELMLHASDNNDDLGPILNGLGTLGVALRAHGIEAIVLSGTATEPTLRPPVTSAVEEWCNFEEGDCVWLSMPYAGSFTSPGDANGIRFDGSLFLPSDVASAGPGVAYIADAGNTKLKIVGWNPGPNPGQPTPVRMWGTDRLDERAFTVGVKEANTALAGMGGSSLIQSIALQSRGQETDYAGVKDVLACIKTPEDPRQPMGVPLGMDVTADATYVADAYCQTIWRIDNQSGETIDVRGTARQDGTDVGACSDGPASFATFGAPVDVSVDPNGNIWFADLGCNSIRVLMDLGKDDATIASELKDYLNGVAGHLPDAVADGISAKLDSLEEEFLATNRWWVRTVAGSYDGDAGFADGPASQALFDVPTALEVMHKGSKTYVFVSDAGNHRIRRIELPQI